METVTSKKDRGGIVGTGFVQTNTLKKDINGVGRFETRVQEFFEKDLIPRDEVIEYANITRKVWQGAVLRLAPAEAMKVTANDLMDLKIIDKIIPEPNGGAHRNPDAAVETVKTEVVSALKELMQVPTEKLLNDRIEKFAKMGAWEE